MTQDKIYCVYIAPNEKMVREHASQGGFPANKVSEIKTTIDPTTAESGLTNRSYGFPAIPCTSKRASNSSLPDLEMPALEIRL